ncbi:HAD-IA family hydrolase [Dermatophilaceae bacterium Sec6.4]
MSAILFGSISTLADTSELQRESFNKAFATHDLGWTWSREDYLEMLGASGGADRIAAYAASRDEQVDAQAVHLTKSQIFQEDIATAGISARPDVAATIADAKEAGFKVGLVTTTSTQNVTALLEALTPEVTAEMFDVIVDITSVPDRKPAGDAYQHAVRSLGDDAAHCVAIEDNIDGVTSAQAAGIACVAFPNANTAEHDFSAAQQRVDRVQFSQLASMLPTDHA